MARGIDPTVARAPVPMISFDPGFNPEPTCVVTSRRARSTGTTVELIDNREGYFEAGGLGWITVCVEHGNYCEHETRKLAESFLAAPEEWCEACKPDEGVSAPWAVA